jgi:hypothetical protein
MRPAASAWKYRKPLIVGIPALSVALLGAVANAQPIGTISQAIDSAQSAAASPPLTTQLASVSRLIGSVDSVDSGLHNRALEREVQETPAASALSLSCQSSSGNEMTVETTDPGRAIVTGKCADIGRIVRPSQSQTDVVARFFDGASTDAPASSHVYDYRIGARFAEKHPSLVSFMKEHFSAILQ